MAFTESECTRSLTWVQPEQPRPGGTPLHTPRQTVGLCRACYPNELRLGTMLELSVWAQRGLLCTA